ncbi:hypothetical protein [Burkholderia ubonensis]|uniref:hypothetical protein n=1 Tax=Burkholderia ubonensis TaxID=101571 RepID=UPI0012F9F7A2|nr:hypothetical protein [Burkholderia ubonensis]
MKDTKQTDDFSSLNADQIHELVAAVREDFEHDLSRAGTYPSFCGRGITHRLIHKPGLRNCRPEQTVVEQ